MSLEVRELEAHDAAAWDRFVATQSGANLYHTNAWRGVVEEIFGHRAVYLMCEEGGEVRGVLPMFLVRFPLLGSKLVSIPYDIGSGGPLAVDAEVERQLATRAIDLARAHAVDYLELRCGSARPSLEGLGLVRSEPVVISDVELDDRDQVWSRVARDHRKAVRKAEKRGVELVEAQTEADFSSFYEIYLRVFRDFGTPPYGKRYFPTLWKRLHANGHVRLLLARSGSDDVGGLVMFCFGDQLVSKFAACLPEAVSLRVYPALYWRAMELGLESGCRRLSWGTSSRSQSGLIEFKERWGAHHRPAVLYDLPVRGKVPSLERYYDSDGLARVVWRKLPLPVTSLLGAGLSRWFC